MKNRKPQISPRTYYTAMIRLLRKCGGCMQLSQLYAEIYRLYYDEMTESDFEFVKGKDYPKWQNQVDYAKALGTKKNETRIVKLFDHTKWIVLLEKDTNRFALHLALNKKKGKSSFTKKCDRCEGYVPQSWDICYCGKQFPPAPPTRDV